MRRPTETRLRQAFADVLTTVLATAAGAAVLGTAACGGSTAGVDGTSSSSGGSSSGQPSFTYSSLCAAPDITKSYLSHIHASPELDGIAQRTESAFLRAPNTYEPGKVTPDPTLLGDQWNGATSEVVGSMCRTAKDPSACIAKVEGYRILPTTREGCIAQYQGGAYYETNGCSTSYLIYTRGDEIGVAQTIDEKRALMGTFDTVGEALWAANNAGYSMSCSGQASNSGKSIPVSQYRKTQDGGWDLQLLSDVCNEEMFRVTVHVDYAGNVTVLEKESLGEGQGCPVAGRRPTGFAFDDVAATNNPIGEHFASMATLEAASVTAFRRLHRQLAAYGAPRELLDRVRKAARDEIRHARATGALAKKYGVTPAAPQIAACEESPSLFVIALENAREGCVRETYGALVAHLQITRAGDTDVRDVMRAIADEETEHAALSWDIAAWIEAQLSDAERAQLATERHDAFRTLARDLASPVDSRVLEVSGVPAAHDALRMLEGLAPMMLAA